VATVVCTIENVPASIALGVTVAAGSVVPGAGIVLGALPGNLVTPHTMALAATGELVIADRDQCALFVVRP
jgi:hypothetical protein